jgi:hypothetical protein
MNHFNKLAILALFSAASLSTIQAQEIRLGGGYSGSIVDKGSEDNWRGRAGYQYGIELVLGNRFFLKSGLFMQVRNLNYTTVGVGEAGVPNGIETETRYTSKALRIPLMGGIRLIEPDENKGFNVYAIAGPTALIGLSADLDDNSLIFTTRSTQWYLGFGAGMEWKFLFLDAGYDVGMSNVFKGEGVNTNPKVNNSYINAGLRFVLNK